MPLQINVGLSRKASRDFQSVGASINIVAELDGQMLAHPDELQRSIANLYAQARAALDRQSVAPAAPPTPATPRRLPPANGHNARPYAGNGNNGGDRAPAPMSEKQRGAIFAIAKRAEVDAYATARQTLGVDLDQLSAREASKLIDTLKTPANPFRQNCRNGLRP